jgi:hypothetical protein
MNDEAPVGANASAPMKHAFVLVLDSLRYDVVSNPEALKFIAPNLFALVQHARVNRVITNAQSTQFVLPALFTCTYPLDYGGYNDGIRDRPKSYVEVLRDAGYETFLLATANQLGIGHGYSRGFDVVGTTSDYRTQLEHRISRTMNYDLDRYRRGEIDQGTAIERVRALFEPLLDALSLNPSTVMIAPFGRLSWSALTERSPKAVLRKSSCLLRNRRRFSPSCPASLQVCTGATSARKTPAVRNSSSVV